MTKKLNRGGLCRLVAGVAFSLFSAGAAQATYLVKGAGIDTSVGSLNGTVSYAPIGFSDTAAVGRLLLTGTNSDTGAAFSWKSYCVDIFDPLTAGTFTAASATTLEIGATKLTQLNALLSNVDAYVTSATTSAAAQLAVWEIVNESASSYDLTAGAFGVKNIGGDATTAANKMLKAVTSGAWKASDSFDMALLTSPGNQTQIVYGANAKSIAAVPEAGTWAMMIVGFGAVGAATRRRRTGMVPA